MPASCTLRAVIYQRMYLSIWFGILMGSAGCSSTDKQPSKAELAAAKRAVPAEEAVFQDNPLSKRLNKPSTMPSVPPAGARLSYSSVNITQPVVAMTFDDGPHPSLTPKLLDILKERNIKCTFFLIGQNVKAYPQIVRRIIAEGHEIGAHTYTHCSLTSRSDAQIRSELQRSEDVLMAAANYRPQLVRPPYGAINTRIKQLMFSEFGYSTIMWSVDPQDWRRPGVSVVTSRLVSGARPGSIMLAHDIHPPTIQAMPAMFDQLLAKGYQFVTVSQLMNMEKANMPVGVVIRPAVPMGEKDPTPLPQ
jgi:peptidoglycan-N-acetylglucosamine deacetylase